MPPKKKAAEVRTDVEVEGEALESEFSVSSPASVASTASAMSGASTEFLEKILEANQRSMAALIAALPSMLATPASSATVPKSARVDVPKWVEGESPWEYFSKYEQALSHNGVPKEKWGSLLQIYLSGSAQASFTQVNPLVVKDYEALKQAMLEALGDTPDGADKRWCTLSRQQGESHRALYRRVHMTGFRRMYGLDTKEQCCQRMILSKFLTLLSPDCYSSVVAKRPRTGQEAAAFAQEFEDDSSFARSLQSKPSGGHFFKSETGNNGVDGVQGNSASDVLFGSPSGGTSGAVPAQTHNGCGSPVVGGEGVKLEQQYQGGRHPVTCFGCGEVGHIRPNCPHKVRRVISEGGGSMPSVNGFLAGVPVDNLMVDTGSDITLVRKDFVPRVAYTRKKVWLDSWRGSQPSRHKMARILIKVGLVEVFKEVAVVSELDCPAVLGNDLGAPMKVELIERMLAQLSEESEVKEQVEDELVAPVPNDSTLVYSGRMVQGLEKDVCTPLVLSEIFDFQDAYFDEDPVPTFVEEKVDVVVEIPLPDLVGVGVDSGELVMEPQVDEPVVQALTSDQKDDKGVCRVLQFAEHPVAPIVATGKSSPDRVVASVFVFCGIVYLYALLCFICSLLVAGDQFFLQLAVLGVTSGGVLRVLRMDPVLPAVCYIRVDTGLVFCMIFCILWCLFFLDWWRRRFKTLHLGLSSIRRGGRCYESISHNM